FREQYNQYWRMYFDPIALRIQIKPNRYRIETLVLPLIDNSIYTQLAQALGGKAEVLESGLISPKTVFSVALKLNKDELKKDKTIYREAMKEVAAGTGELPIQRFIEEG